MKAIFGLSIAGNMHCRGKKIASAIENFIRLHRRDNHFFTFLIMDSPQKANIAIEIENIDDLLFTYLMLIIASPQKANIATKIKNIGVNNLHRMLKYLEKETNTLLTNWLAETEQSLLNMLDIFRKHKGNPSSLQITQDASARDKIEEINAIFKSLNIKAEIVCWNNFLADVDFTKLAESENKYFKTLQKNTKFQQAHENTVIGFANRALKRKYKITITRTGINYYEKGMQSYSKDEFSKISKYFAKCQQAAAYYINAEMVKLIQAYDNGYRDIYYPGKVFPIFKAAKKCIFATDDPMLWHNITKLTIKSPKSVPKDNITGINKKTTAGLKAFINAINGIRDQLPLNDEVLLIILINFFLQNAINKIFQQAPYKQKQFRKQLATEIEMLADSNTNSRACVDSPQLLPNDLPPHVESYRRGSTPNVTNARQLYNIYSQNNIDNSIAYFLNLKKVIKSIYFNTRMSQKEYQKLLNKINSTRDLFIKTFKETQINPTNFLFQPKNIAFYAECTIRGLNTNKNRKNVSAYKLHRTVDVKRFLKILAGELKSTSPATILNKAHQGRNFSLNCLLSFTEDSLNNLSQLIPTPVIQLVKRDNERRLSGSSGSYSISAYNTGNSSQSSSLKQHGIFHRRSSSTTIGKYVLKTRRRMLSYQNETFHEKKSKGKENVQSIPEEPTISTFTLAETNPIPRSPTSSGGY